jgi:predicted HD phosphohydrolase
MGELMEKLDSIRDLFDRMKVTPQPAKYHPEGDVFTHTAIVYASMKFATRGDAGSAALKMAAVFHDIGKVATTVVHDNGKITAYGHEHESVRIFDKYQPVALKGMNPFEVDAARYIIKNHMKIKLVEQMRPTKVQQLIDEAVDIVERHGFAKGNTFLYYHLQHFSNFDDMLHSTYVRIHLRNLTATDVIEDEKERLDYFINTLLQSRVNVHNLIVERLGNKRDDVSIQETGGTS